MFVWLHLFFLFFGDYSIINSSNQRTNNICLFIHCFSRFFCWCYLSSIINHLTILKIIWWQVKKKTTTITMMMLVVVTETTKRNEKPIMIFCIIITYTQWVNQEVKNSTNNSARNNVAKNASRFMFHVSYKILVQFISTWINPFISHCVSACCLLVDSRSMIQSFAWLNCFVIIWLYENFQARRLQYVAILTNMIPLLNLNFVEWFIFYYFLLFCFWHSFINITIINVN